MLLNSSKSTTDSKVHRRWYMVLLLPFWVVFCFALAQAVLVGIAVGLSKLGLSIDLLNPAVVNTVIAALVYILTLLLVIGLPWWLRRRRTSRSEIGLKRLPSWMDILLAPAGFVIYMLLSAAMLYLATQFLPGFDTGEVQDVGFSDLTHQYQYILAFVTLVILAPVAEEVLFRGYLYGKLKRYVPMWLAVLVTSAMFGLVHGQWNVGLDVFVLSIVLCALREVTGNIWAGVLLHMLKNGVAFYFLFINTSLLLQ